MPIGKHRNLSARERRFPAGRFTGVGKGDGSIQTCDPGVGENEQEEGKDMKKDWKWIVVAILLFAVIAFLLYMEIRADIDMFSSDIPWWMKWKLFFGIR